MVQGPENHEAGRAEGATARLKVLIVEDTPINLELLTHAVEEIGYEVVQAMDGRQALERVADSCVSLVLLDYLLPDMSGVKVLRKLRETASPIELPVIIVTAYYETDKVIEVLSVGANDYVHKPFEIEVLQARINAHLKIKSMEDALRLAKEAAERANVAKSDYLSFVSHELRTPLSAIVGYTGLIQHELEKDGNSDLLEIVGGIQEAGERLISLTDELLDLARIEAGKLELDIRDFSIKSLIDSCAAEVKPLVAKNHNSIRIESDDHIGNFAGDERRIHQILLNLLSNAAKYTTDGVIDLRAKRMPGNNGDQLQLIVSDTGMGIPNDRLDQLFREFSRIHTSSAPDVTGVGLGLMIAKQLCHRMGGDIQVESNEGEGSTFIVTIPHGEEAGSDMDRP